MSDSSAVKLPGASELGTTISMHTSFGGGKKKHRGATQEVIESKGVTNRKRVSVQVDLFAASPHLDSAKKMAQALRNHINSQTLPWGDDGRRFVPNSIKVELDNYARKEIAAIDEEMEKHFSSYLDQKKLWESEGGGLAKTGIEFPSEAVGRSKYSIELVPGIVTSADDIRVGGLSGDQRKRFIEDVRAAESSRIQGTVRNVAERVEDVLTRMVDRMGAYGKDENGKVQGKFHNTIVGNVREIAGLLDHFNITGDPEIENVRRRLVNEICVVTPEQLREDEGLRKDIQNKANDILSRVGMIGSKKD